MKRLEEEQMMENQQKDGSPEKLES